MSRTTWVRQHQKGKTNLDLLEQEIVNGSGISWAICKSAPRPRHIAMPASHHLVFCRPDTLLATHPTASKHWRHHFHRVHYNFLFTFYRSCASVLNFFSRYNDSYLSKVTNVNLPDLHKAPTWEWPHSNFSYILVSAVPRLLLYMALFAWCSAILIELQLVTDRWIVCHASIVW